MKGIILIDVPENLIGQEVSIYFKDIFTKTATILPGDIDKPKGEWIPIDDKDEIYDQIYRCSLCGHDMIAGIENRYCPHCGYPMNIDEEEKCENCKYFHRLMHNFKLGSGFERSFACDELFHREGIKEPFLQEVKDPERKCKMYEPKEWNI